MKNAALLALTALALSTPAAALMTPYKINYQGKLLDSATNQPRNGTYKMQFVLYDAPSGGTARYTEVQSAVNVSNGVFFVQIGSAATLSPDLLADTSSYLGISVCANPPCTVDPEMTPRQQLVMSPYAYTAMQLSSDQDIRVNPGPTAYSTFTTAGNLLLSAGLSASSGNFVNGVTASSGTFTQTGGVYGVVVSSGINLQAGQLQIGDPSRVISDDPTTASTRFSSNVVIVGNVSAANLNWMFLSSATLNAAAASLVSNFSADGYTSLHLQIYVSGVAATSIVRLQFNGDTATNYAWAASQGGGNSTSGTAVAFIQLGNANATTPELCGLTVLAVLNFPKLVTGTCTRTSGSAVAPIQIESSGVWGNTTALVNSVTVTASGGNINAGSTVRVYGAR